MLKGTVQLKIGFALVHLVGLEMVQDAFSNTSFGPKNAPKTIFWGKMVNASLVVGGCIPRGGGSLELFVSFTIIPLFAMN